MNFNRLSNIYTVYLHEAKCGCVNLFASSEHARYIANFFW